MTHAAIEPVPREELERANAIYAQLRFAPSDPERDETLWVLEAGRPIALGRVSVHDDGSYEVGGFWTHPVARGRGWARRMVAHTLTRLPGGTRCWCIPFDHLADFYRSFGMRDPAPDERVPPTIAARQARCRADACRGELEATTLLLFETPRSPPRTARRDGNPPTPPERGRRL